MSHHRSLDRLPLGRWLPVCIASLVIALNSVCSALAWDGPADNRTDQARRLPKLGVEVPGDIRSRWETQLAELSTKIERIKNSDSALQSLWPDVAIFHKAVHDALMYQEFFEAGNFAVADRLLVQGHERADQLLAGQAPWASASGLVVRGYVSRIDDSVQPYGLVIPSGFRADSPHPMPLDLWFHGRGETLTEWAFLDQRQSNAGQFAPAEAIVLHPYGRYCNANKFAGEVDVYEALEAVQSQYRIDEDRITARGFSMGGASAWHLAVHDPGRWAAANPGAGFSETPEFLQTFQSETLTPYWWERTLWHWYDATDWASNLRHVPTIAYSGERDRQIQAATAMERAATEGGLALVHLVGPETGHSYHPQTAIEVERRIRQLSRIGRDRTPHSIDFTTYSLRYPTMRWLTISAMAQHWHKARVQARLHEEAIELRVEGVTGVDLSFEPGTFPYAFEPEIRIWTWQGDRWLRSTLPAAETSLPINGLLNTDRSWRCRLVLGADGWRLRTTADDQQLRKKPGLNGPIDDAFMAPFLFVKPSGEGKYPMADAWSISEMERAIEQWRRHFRGHARVKLDTEVDDEDLANYHIVLWGDAHSNRLWQRMAHQLPIVERDGEWKVGDRSFPADTHAPIFIYPNPLNPERYVVANSSFTFREYAYLNNARQVPVLPDWAMVDLREPAGFVYPGAIAAADFFDEKWQVSLPIPEPRRVEAPPVAAPETPNPQGAIQPRRPMPQLVQSDVVADSPSEPSFGSIDGCVDDPVESIADQLQKRVSQGEVVLGAERSVTTEDEQRFWLRNAIGMHGFSLDEIQAATGLNHEQIVQLAERWKITPFGEPNRASEGCLAVWPYPGGRHPRIGFLDGAIKPQRETKLSVFLPWDSKSYVVCDFPEAIWSDLGLTYLAHTHVKTIWEQQGIELEPQEWQAIDERTWKSQRTLPNGIEFCTEAQTHPDHVAFRMTLTNGSDEPRSDLRVQNCVMLKAARCFEQQINDNKVIRGRLVAVRNADADRWIISGWEPIDRPWANAPCPCLHADPKFPDCGPQETRTLYGWLSFYEGTDIDSELTRIEAIEWAKSWDSATDAQR